MGNTNNLKFNMIAAILFVVLAFIQLLSFGMTFNIFGFLRFAAFIVLAVALFMNKKDNVVKILIFTGLGILALLMLYNFFYNFSTSAYSISKSSYSYTFGLTHRYHFNIFCIFPMLIEVIAYLGMLAVAFCMFTDYIPKFQKTVKIIWFLPAILVMASFILLFLLAFIIEVFTPSTWTYGHAICNFTNFVSHILLTAAFLFAAGWIVEFSGFEKKQFILPEVGTESYQNTSGQPQAPVYAASANTGYINILHHVLLLIFTFGIWYLVWIYKTTGYLNKVQDEPPRNPTTKLLLCMFIPFYSIYWTYKSAQRIDKLARNQGIISDLTTLCLILAIFIGIIPPIIMQDKINSIVSNTQPGSSVPPGGFQGYNPQQGNQYNTGQQNYNFQANNTYNSNQQDYNTQTSNAYNTGQHTYNTQTNPQPDSNQHTNSAQHTDADSIAEELKKYKELLDSGLISQEDFDKKKQQLLGI